MAEGFSMIVMFNGADLTMQCSPSEKMKDILYRFSVKINKDIKNLYFLYEGIKIDENKTYEEIINREDKDKKQMKLIGYELDNLIKQEMQEYLDNNYIIGELKIEEEDINKDIRIINSYEESLRINK